MSQKNEILFEKRESIGIIILNNPPHNYLYDPEFLDIKSVVKWITDNKLKGLILTGVGRNFSAGADLKTLFEQASDIKQIEKKISKGKKVLSFLENINIPTVAAINGICFGGGLEIALSCHIRVSSDNSLFAFPESNYSLIPGLGGLLKLYGICGVKKTLEIALSGNTFDASNALSNKIIDIIVPKNELIDYSVDYLKKLTANRDLEVINSIVVSLNNAKRLDIETGMKEETKLFCKLAYIEAKKKDVK
ncbi:MAG: enoyl-CoA hydratase/isomerase family protein [Spirochaetes bacterium]|nr:enoyl-CoA hydratase/isomerase family protein [Spirochaetota bacterium]